MQSFFLEESKAFLRYLDLPGNSPARIYLHGLICASSADFPRIAADPVLWGHRSILVDFLGCGYSDRPDSFGYTVDDHAGSIAKLLDHLRLSGTEVIGHSMGGAVAIALAALRPDLISRLLVAEGSLDPEPGLAGIASQSEDEFRTRGFHDLLQKWLDQKKFTRYGTLQVCAPHAIHRGAVCLVKGTTPSIRERFMALRIPRTFIFGERSLPDPDREQLAAQGIQVLVVPNAGHPMMIDNPEGFARILQVALTVPSTPKSPLVASVQGPC